MLLAKLPILVPNIEPVTPNILEPIAPQLPDKVIEPNKLVADFAVILLSVNFYHGKFSNSIKDYFFIRNQFTNLLIIVSCGISSLGISSSKIISSDFLSS